MKFNYKIIKYLKGKVLSNNLHLTIAESQSIIYDRLSFLETKVKAKKIIHLGCTDHEEVIDYKIKNNLWLHLRLTKSSEKCIGVDINSKMVSLLKERYKIDNM